MVYLFKIILFQFLNIALSVFVYFAKLSVRRFPWIVSFSVLTA